MIPFTCRFYVPYPGHNGLPTISAGGFIAMAAAVFAGIAESIGDYHACANIVDAPPPPPHIVARYRMVYHLLRCRSRPGISLMWKFQKCRRVSTLMKICFGLFLQDSYYQKQVGNVRPIGLCCAGEWIFITVNSSINFLPWLSADLQQRSTPGNMQYHSEILVPSSTIRCMSYRWVCNFTLEQGNRHYPTL